MLKFYTLAIRMRENEHTQLPDDEIDFKRVGRRLARAAVYPLGLLLKHPKTTLLFILLGVGGALALRYSTDKIYSASFLIRPSDMTDKMYTKILNDLSVFVKQEDHTALSQILSISKDEAAQLSKIRINNYSFRVGMDSSYYSEIVIETKAPWQLHKVESAILSWLESSPYYARIKDLQKAQIDLTTAQVDADLLMLDSLKRLQLNLHHAVKGNELATALLVNPASVYTVSADRLEKKSRLLGQLQFLNRFNLLKSCVIPDHYIFPPRLALLILVFVCFGLFVEVLWLTFRN